MPLYSGGLAWDRRSDVPRLGEREVQVYSVRLDVDDAALEALRRHLSPDEQERAARFVFHEHRKRFEAAHGALREILAAATGVPVREIAFTVGSHGKPALVGSASEFNLSHSGDMALVALSPVVVGVDVERIRPDFTGDDIAERFFSRREAAALRAQPADRRVRAFFRCWTSKEAFIKAHGQGLSYGLDRFDVVIDPARPASLLRTEAGDIETRRWSLCDLVTPQGYAGAVCAAFAAGSTWTLSRWHWAPRR